MTAPLFESTITSLPLTDTYDADLLLLPARRKKRVTLLNPYAPTKV